MGGTEHQRPKGWFKGLTTRWTVTITFLLLLGLKIEQLMVKAIGAANPEAMLEEVGFPLNIGVYLLSPLLHTGGGHIATNLLWFVLFGVLLEQRVKLRDYLGFILGVGVIANFVAPFALQLVGLSVGFAIGMSGVTNALGMRETIYRAVVLSDQKRSSSGDWMIFLVAITVTVLSAAIILKGNTQPGNSVVAHATGLVLGGIFAIAEVEGFTKSYDWMQDRYQKFVA